MEKLTRDKAWELLKHVQHPAINFSLAELGILKDIEISGNMVTITLALPFPNIPIVEPLSSYDMEIGVETVLMTEQEKQRFLDLEHQGWKG